MRTEEHGQATVFVIGMALVAFAVVAFVVDGTRAFLLRRTLQGAADAAALAGASQLDERAYYSSGGARVMIEPGAGRSAASELLTRRALGARAAISATPEGVTVVLRSEMPTAFLQVIGIGDVPVAAEAVAEPLPAPPP